MVKPSSKQLQVIGYIQSNLGITFKGKTTQEAREWISKHIEDSMNSTKVDSSSAPSVRNTRKTRPRRVDHGVQSRRESNYSGNDYIGIGEEGYFEGNKAFRDHEGTYHVYGEPDVGGHFGKKVVYHDDPEDTPMFGGRRDYRDSDGM